MSFKAPTKGKWVLSTASEGGASSSASPSNDAIPTPTAPKNKPKPGARLAPLPRPHQLRSLNATSTHGHPSTPPGRLVTGYHAGLSDPLTASQKPASAPVKGLIEPSSSGVGASGSGGTPKKGPSPKKAGAKPVAAVAGSPPKKKCHTEGILKYKLEVDCRGLTEDTFFCVRFSPDGKTFAATAGDGRIYLFNNNGVFQKKIQAKSKDEDLPCPSLRFLPRNSNVALVACANGSVQRIDFNHSNVTRTIWEDGNEVLAVDYSGDGSMFASAGSDRIVRLYDEKEGKLIVGMQSGYDAMGRVTAGHSNRVYSVLFADNNLLLSAGWDRTVQVHDIRTGKSVRTLFGPHVSGDGMDIRQQQLVVGSCEPKQQLRMFNYVTGREMSCSHLCPQLGDTSIYCAKFHPQTGAIWCVGTQPTQIVGLEPKKGTLSGRMSNIPKGLFSFDLSPDGKQMVACGAQGTLMLLSL